MPALKLGHATFREVEARCHMVGPTLENICCLHCALSLMAASPEPQVRSASQQSMCQWGCQVFLVFPDVSVIAFLLNGYNIVLVYQWHGLLCQLQWQFSFSFSISLCSDGCIDLPEVPYISWERNVLSLKNQEIFEIGSLLKYDCKTGYRPTPNEPRTVTCQENLKWAISKGCESKRI